MIKWKDEYSVGVEQIDNQHRRLFEIAGRAYNLLKEKLLVDKYDQIAAILQELKDYAVYHFDWEEEYMRSIGYRKYLSHKVIHDDFIERINAIVLEQVDTDQDKHLLDILDFVVSWIDGHILGQDKQYMQS